MTRHLPVRVSDVRGAARLAVEATREVAAIVEAMHARIALPLGPAAPATRGVTRLVYRSIRGITALVGRSVDTAFDVLAPLTDGRGGGPASPAREAVISALNGVLGDHLAATRNPLAISAALRVSGRALVLDASLGGALPHATDRLLVLLHGLCMNDLQWTRSAHDHGAALARDHGFTALHLHYNSGLHVSTNGRALSDLLEGLVRHWPVPLQDVTIVAHSMGGLVARSACAAAQAGGHAWLQRLRSIVFLGTPHLGAPLERGGNVIDRVLGSSSWTAPFARLGRLRSAGITDLRHGSVVDEDWRGRDRFVPSGARGAVALPEGVACYAIAATTRGQRSGRGRLPGDGLVPVDSALGRHRDRRRSLRIPPARRHVVYGTDHFGLLESPEVYARLHAWLARG